MQTIQEIQQAMSIQIEKATGAIVEVTNRGDRKWTISGEPDEVANGVDFLVSQGIMTVESSDLDDEDNILYAYMKEEIADLPDHHERHEEWTKECKKPRNFRDAMRQLNQ